MAGKVSYFGAYLLQSVNLPQTTVYLFATIRSVSVKQKFTQTSLCFVKNF